MSVRNLESLFAPKHVAVFGASERPDALGTAVLRNLLSAGFTGTVFAVNPKYATVQGQKCFKNLKELSVVPDLAVLCTPPDTIPELIASLGQLGTRGAVVMTAGIDKKEGEHASAYAQMMQAAKASLLRIVGPNCIGIQVPGIGLNASFAHLNSHVGNLAFVSQSGAILTAVLDWSVARGIGFSHIVSLGDMADVDFGDMLDYLTADTATKAILLYIEAISDARKFMSAARAASRLKPVIVLKSGRFASSAAAVASHTGALAGEDRVYDAAFRRGGALRVFDIEELFAAAETLAFATPLEGERLAILTNGGGLGVLAADALAQMRGTLAKLDASTIARLNASLPSTWSHANPVDIIGDASPERYRAALEALLTDGNSDAVLVLNCPTAVASSLAAAQAVCASAKENRRALFTCWAGEHTAAQARAEFTHNGIATFDAPELAVRGFMHRVRYLRNQKMLQQLPASVATEFVPARIAARTEIDRALAEGREWLSEVEAKFVLAAYRIPTVRTLFARTPEEASSAASNLKTECVLKIVSKDVLHKSDAGGVVLGLKTPGEVESAARRMLVRIKENVPNARIDGFSVQEMIELPHARELIAGMREDPQFGPVIMVGQGGVDVEAIDDIAVELAPINETLATDMIARTRAARLLAAHRGQAASNVPAVAEVLVKISQLAADMAEIVELDINPLLVNQKRVMALDARIRIRKPKRLGTARFSIRPYPVELEESAVLPSGRNLLLRPVRPEDAHDFERLFRELAPEDIRLRFFRPLRELPDLLAARLTQIDYDREMAFVAFDQGDPSHAIAVARISADPDMQRAEFAVLVHSKMKHSGIGMLLMQRLIAYARERGVKELFAEVLHENAAMLALCGKLGFTLTPTAGAGWVVHVSKRLD